MNRPRTIAEGLDMLAQEYQRQQLISTLDRELARRALIAFGKPQLSPVAAAERDLTIIEQYFAIKTGTMQTVDLELRACSE